MRLPPVLECEQGVFKAIEATQLRVILTERGSAWEKSSLPHPTVRGSALGGALAAQRWIYRKSARHRESHTRVQPRYTFAWDRHGGSAAKALRC